MDDKGFKLSLRMEAEKALQEYLDIQHERRRLVAQIERTKRYLEKLNAFLVSEGQEPVSIPDCEDIEGIPDWPPYEDRLVTQPANRPKPVGEKAEGVNS